MATSQKQLASTADLADDDTFRIMLATDIHLGHQIDHPIRHMDTFVTFDEILSLTKSHNSDFLLLGGDLYDRNEPGPKAHAETCRILEKYVFGLKKPKFELISPPDVAFGSLAACIDDIDRPNWLLDWVNIELPVLSVHGNHDNPNGRFSSSPIDLLATLGLLSHFGRVRDANKVAVYPVTLKKGKTVINIYGIGSVKDERLNALILEDRVRFVAPAEVNQSFNILVLHQNRSKRGPSEQSYFHEKHIPKFIDFVLWGHEHDNRVALEYSAIADCFITQPGSTVPTSLTEGESLRKSIGQLIVNQNRFTFVEVPLETTRVVMFSSLSLHEIVDLEIDVHGNVRLPDNYVMQTEMGLDTEIERLLRIAESDRAENFPAAPATPMVRVRLIHSMSTFIDFNANLYCRKWEGKIANTDIVLVKTKAARKTHQMTKLDPAMEKALSAEVNLSEQLLKYVQHDLATRKAENGPTGGFQLLDEHTTVTFIQNLLNIRQQDGASMAIGKPIQEMVQCQLDAVSERIESQLQLTRGGYEDLRDMTEDDIERFLASDLAKRAELWMDKDVEAEIEKYRTKQNTTALRPMRSSSDEAMSDEPVSAPAKKKRATSTRGRARGRAKK